MYNQNSVIKEAEVSKAKLLSEDSFYTTDVYFMELFVVYN